MIYLLTVTTILALLMLWVLYRAYYGKIPIPSAAAGMGGMSRVSQLFIGRPA